MADNQHLSHTGQGGSSVSHRIEATGYDFWTGVGENIAMGYRDVNSVMNGWMRSIGHRYNILGNWEHVGFGVAKAQNGAIYWVADFARPSRNGLIPTPSERQPVQLSGPLIADPIELAK